MRPRIRTLKPEVWSDEKVGDLSHGARLLFVGLITMADDEGRLRELPAAILGHVFPYDNVSTAKLSRWLGEIERCGMVVRYAAHGKRYLAFPHWTDHQRVDKPNDSELPPPPNSPNGSGNGRGVDPGTISDSIADQSCLPRTGASGPIPSDPPSSPRDGETRGGRAPSKRVDQHEPPVALPGELHCTAHSVLQVLEAVQTERGGDVPTIRGVGLAMLRCPHRDFLRVAREVEHWALAGRGQRKPVKDWARTFGTFLDNTPEGAPVRDGNVVPMRPSVIDRMNRFENAVEYQGGDPA